jgi:hypothetical protein
MVIEDTSNEKSLSASNLGKRVHSLGLQAKVVFIKSPLGHREV